MQIGNWINQMQRTYRQYVRWPRTWMHWLCVVLFLITHTIIIWLQPTQVQAATSIAVKQMIALSRRDKTLVETEQGNLKSSQQVQLEALPIKEGVTVAQSSAPDLVVSALSTSNTNASWGQKVDLTWIVTNQGSQATTRGWTDGIYLSKDNVYDSNDLLLGYKSVTTGNFSLPPSASYTTTQVVNVPWASFLTPEHRYIIVGAGFYYSLQTETSRTNNTQAIKAIAPPDLVVSAANAPNFERTSKSVVQVPVTWTTTNRSDRNVNLDWYDAVYLSQDGVLDASDYRVASVNSPKSQPTLAPGASYTLSAASLPAISTSFPDGYRYLLIATDDVYNKQPETEECNNSRIVDGGGDPSAKLNNAQLKKFYDDMAVAAIARQDYATTFIANAGLLGVQLYAGLTTVAELGVAETDNLIAVGQENSGLVGYLQQGAGQVLGLIPRQFTQEKATESLVMLASVPIAEAAAGMQAVQKLLATPGVLPTFGALGAGISGFQVYSGLSGSNPLTGKCFTAQESFDLTAFGAAGLFASFYATGSEISNRLSAVSRRLDDAAQWLNYRGTLLETIDGIPLPPIKGVVPLKSVLPPQTKGEIPNTVKLINGKPPRNADLAGKTYPLERLPADLQKKYPNSVKFTDDGFPDFSPYITKEVEVDGLIGDHYYDFIKANEKAGFGSSSKPPDDYTWHHYQDGRKMQLVPRDLHSKVGHTGGAKIIQSQQKL
jgi:hypothetical protein